MALKSCPKSNKLPNLVTLDPFKFAKKHFRQGSEVVVSYVDTLVHMLLHYLTQTDYHLGIKIFRCSVL